MALISLHNSTPIGADLQVMSVFQMVLTCSVVCFRLERLVALVDGVVGAATFLPDLVLRPETVY